MVSSAAAGAGSNSSRLKTLRAVWPLHHSAPYVGGVARHGCCKQLLPGCGSIHSMYKTAEVLHRRTRFGSVPKCMCMFCSCAVSDSGSLYRAYAFAECLSVGLHLQSCICRAAFAELHSQSCICRAASAELHQMAHCHWVMCCMTLIVHWASCTVIAMHCSIAVMILLRHWLR